jgi:hypothetical protein
MEVKNMKKIVFGFVMIVFLFGSVTPGLLAQEKSVDEQQKKMMEKWMQFATPGEPHRFLDKRVGEWDVVTRMWREPGAPPDESTGSAVGKMMLGGRYLKLKHRGTVNGMPFEGISIGGYDNHLKEFFSIWIDNVGTGIMISRGSLEPTAKTLTEVAEVDDFMTGQKMKTRTVTTLVNPDKFFMEMYMIGPDGKEFKSLEVTYTRKK